MCFSSSYFILELDYYYTFFHTELFHLLFLKSNISKTQSSEYIRRVCQIFPIVIVLASVQFSLSVVSDSATPWTASCQASLSITNSWSLLKLMSIESGMPSNHLILCHPFLLLPSIFPSIRVISSDSVLHIRWPKYCIFSFSISPSNEYSRLISFMIDWLDLLAVQGTLKSLLQHHSSKALILWCSAFFIVQVSHPHMTTGKTISYLEVEDEEARCRGDE